MQEVKTQRHRVAKTKKMLVTELVEVPTSAFDRLRHRRLMADG
jgi:hypothetical protein